MSQFTRTNGDYKPVLNLDSPAYTNTGVNVATSAATVQPQGPKLEYFTIALANVATDGTVLFNAINTIQQLATIYIYEVTDASTDTLAVAVYPVGAWTLASLDTATGGTTSNGATFTN